MADLFESLGFDFGFDDDFGAAPKAEKPKAEKPKTEKKTAAKKTAAKKGLSAKEVALAGPVTVKGRNFVFTYKTEGATNAQAVLKAAVEAGYSEIKHSALKFYKNGESEIVISYGGLSVSEDDDAVTLPVTVLDGQRKAVYSAAAEVKAEEGEDITVSQLSDAGISHEIYAGASLDYDSAAGVALPVFEEVGSADLAKTVKVGDAVIVNGEQKEVESPADMIADILGEIPSGYVAVVEQSAERGVFFMRLAPTPANKDEFHLDLAEFGIKEVTEKKKAAETICLPVTLYIANLGSERKYTPEHFGGKVKVVWEDFLDQVKKDVRLLRSAERRIDHYYDREEGRVAVSFASGRKG